MKSQRCVVLRVLADKNWEHYMWPHQVRYENYKKWIREEEDSQLRSKLNQLYVEDHQKVKRKCFVERKLTLRDDKKGREFTPEELLKNITKDKICNVIGESGEGKSTIASTIVDNWAKSENTKETPYVIIFLSSLQKTEKLPLHKLIWGEYCGQIGDNSEEIFKDLKKGKENVIVIIDGLGSKYYCL